MKNSKKESNTLKVLITKMEECDDFRYQPKVHYTLAEILFLTFCASVCGSSEYKEIVDFGELKLEWLRKYLKYKNGIPSADTIARVLSILNTKQLEKMLSDFCKHTINLNGKLINIDGKKLRKSATAKEQQTKKSEGGKQAVTMVNVFCTEIHTCLASVKVSSKSGEKNALEDVLTMLDVSNCLLTLDAGYCYTDVTKQIVEAEADYLIGLKGNQPKLFEATKELFKGDSAIETFVGEEEKGHNRVEQRTCKVININDLSNEIKEQHSELFSNWIGIQCLVMIVSQRKVKLKNMKYKTSNESRYYITSRNMTAQNGNESVRAHWGVENCLHWILDVVFGEDLSTKRKGNSAANFSIILKLAYNKVKAYDDPKVSMKRKRKKCAMSESYMENILQIV